MCKVDQKNVVNDCPSGFDLVQMGYDKRCLKWETSSRPWIEAENKCQSYGGNLVHIMNEQEQKDFNQWHIGKVHKKDDDWMNEKWAGSWIGLTDIYSGSVLIDVSYGTLSSNERARF